MTYAPNHSHSLRNPQPLIDLIPDSRHTFDVSDEEDSFYGNDDDFLLPPKWQTHLAHTNKQLPRRFGRVFGVLTVVVLVSLVAWCGWLRPRYISRMEVIKDMDTAPASTYGSNVSPTFKDIIQVSDMAQEHLPKHNKRLVFVGDVHGCKKELEHLLKKVDFDQKHDHVILTGDMVAKGPDSAGVVKLMKRLGASCVRGNWEDKLLLTVAAVREQHPSFPESVDLGEDHDSALVMDSTALSGDPALVKLAKTFTKSELVFLQQCPVILRVGHVPHLGSLVAVHAGLVPDISLENQDPFHVMNMRTIDLKTRTPSSKHKGTPWEKFWNHQQEKLKPGHRTTVVYGHNRKRGLNIQNFSFGLDTGCVNGGHLTALVVDARGKTEIVSVKCHSERGYEAD